MNVRWERNSRRSVQHGSSQVLLLSFDGDFHAHLQPPPLRNKGRKKAKAPSAWAGTRIFFFKKNAFISPFVSFFIFYFFPPPPHQGFSKRELSRWALSRRCLFCKWGGFLAAEPHATAPVFCNASSKAVVLFLRGWVWCFFFFSGGGRGRLRVLLRL